MRNDDRLTRHEIIAIIALTAAILAIGWLVFLHEPHTALAGRGTPVATLPPVQSAEPSYWPSSSPIPTMPTITHPPRPRVTLPPTDTR